MLSATIYCKSHKRRPIRFGAFPSFRDVQGDIPRSWCSVCGSEVFDCGQDRCIRCRSVKGENLR